MNLAHQFSLLAYFIVIAIGLVQGLILGEAIVERFPRLVSRARLTSALLFSLFAANAILRTMNFAAPKNITISQVFALTTLDQLVSIVLKIIDLNADAGAIIAFCLTLLILLLLKLTALKAYGRAFILIINVAMIIIIFAIRFSDYKPTSFEIFLYMLYQAGITGGIIWGTWRKLYNKDLRFRYFRQRWTGRTEL